jgi:putative membrane protein
VTDLEGRPEPDYRFTLANERTFLAWNRTSLALIAGGLAIGQLLPDAGLRTARRIAGCVLVLLGGVIGALAHEAYRRREQAIRSGAKLPASSLPRYLTAAVALGAIGAAVLVVLSD